MEPSKGSRVLSILSTLLLHISMATSDQHSSYFQCLHSHPDPSHPISPVIYTPESSSYESVLRSYIRNLKFASPTTPKPLFILTPTHPSHIQAAIICCKIHDLQLRIRSGGHDYEGLSYVSEIPFVILDLFNLKSINVNAKEETAWVQSGATLGELFYRIAEKTELLAFPGGVCPTVGVGGHFSGGGYGNLMRKYGLTVDHVIDAQIIDVNGRILDRSSMGEDLFWAIRGGGGASFGVVLSWKIKLVPVPEIVTVFKVERTLEEGATEIIHKWQLIADEIDENLFIRVVIMPVVRREKQTLKAKFVALFLGTAKLLLDLMNERFPELGMESKNCIEMGWIESVLFWSNYPNGTPAEVLLDRMPKSESFLKKKSDYVKEPISVTDLKGIWEEMIDLKKPVLTFNPYGGRMGEISESETPFPHRVGNKFKIQYSVQWKDGGEEAWEKNLDAIRRLYDYMTPYVSKSPRGAYLNYRDIDLGRNGNGGEISYREASVWGKKYFMGNFDRLVEVKTMVDPDNFFRYEQSIPSAGLGRQVS